MSKPLTWWRCLRAYSFPASIVPVLVGTAYAAAVGVNVRWWLFPLVLLGGVALHVGTNLINDAADFERGIDTVGAKGGSGVLVAGLLSSKQVWIGALVAYAIAAAASVPILWIQGWPLLVIGILGAIGGYAYTGPPFGLKYRACGEVLVFIMMGLLMVSGAAFAMSGEFPGHVWFAAVPIGFLVAAILAANNQRDLDEDQKTHIRTLAIIFRAQGAKIVTAGLVVGAYLSVVGLALFGWIPRLGLLSVVTFPLAIPLLRKVWRDSPMPDGVVEGIAKLHLSFGFAYAIGYGIHVIL